MPEAWRARVRVGGTVDCSEEAWLRDEVGSSYGAWTFEDWQRAIENNDKDPWEYLKNLPNHNSLGWGKWLPSLNSIKRFMTIPEDDWIVMYLPNLKEIAIAQIYGEVKSEKDHPLNRFGEIFKFRKIRNKKIFKIRDLPDAYRILPTQGRQGNFHKFHVMLDHVNLLIETSNEKELADKLNSRSNSEIIDFLGPSAWESFCFAFLILEENFVPTGLAVGGTLPTADIVGRNIFNGCRVIAQCKKNKYPVDLEDDFVELYADNDKTIYYYFAFGGCAGTIPDHIKVIDKRFIETWSANSNGAKYAKVFKNE